MDQLQKLDELKQFNQGAADTTGLEKNYVEQFLARDPLLAECVDVAYEAHCDLREQEVAPLLRLPENEQVSRLQAGYLNFYDSNSVNPYVPLAARGPWIVTTCGAVVHDSGGYGMLGFGHAPEPVLNAMNGEQVMANVMTASFSQHRAMAALRSEIGHRRGDKPFSRFVWMNSGSEAVTVALRISDVNAKIQTGPDGSHTGQKIVLMSHRGAFHGRTDRPAQASDSSLKKYQFCASFAERKNLVTIEPNNKEALQNAFDQAQSRGEFVECFLVEPVMGEGNPGVRLRPDFYALARQLTKQNNTLLLCDSIQAGLRAFGCLSVVDYPGFEKLEGPDMETYSKALNAGQYPCSVLALNDKAAGLYRPGIYGNTMTTNPRALDVACAVLGMVTPEVRNNIVQKGEEFLQKLRQLADKLDGKITDVTGTGLLFATHLDPKRYKAAGAGSVEVALRKKGIGVIHGGANALRFTPHFKICSAEIDMIVEHVARELR